MRTDVYNYTRACIYFYALSLRVRFLLRLLMLLIG